MRSRIIVLMRDVDLSKLVIPSDPGSGEHWRPAAVSATANIEVHFVDLVDRMVDFVSSAHFVAGCVAWLTNDKVLSALAATPHGCQIVVQKEDFLRPDFAGNGAKPYLRGAYGRLRCNFDRHQLPAGVGELSQCGDPSVAAVRCMGVSSQRGQITPKMHHKFLVACRIDGSGEKTVFSPVAAWTGSFNITKNAERCLENAVIIHDPTVAAAYLREWAHVFALSEPLDWNHR